jgi:hypothetical protein
LAVSMEMEVVSEIFSGIVLLVFIDTTQAPYPHIDRCRPKLFNAYWSSYKNADNFPHTRRQRLSTHTNSSTFALHSNASFPHNAWCSRSVLPITISTLVSYATYLSLISYSLFSLAYCCITYPLSSSHILSPHICLTHCLNSFS